MYTDRISNKTIWIAFHYLARCQILQSEKIDLVGRLNFVVISWIRECQWQETLLFQICLVDTSETLDDDSATSKMSWFQGSVFPGGTFAVVLVTYCDPLYTLLLVITCNVRHGAPFICQLIFYLVHLAIFRIDGAKKKVEDTQCKNSFLILLRAILCKKEVLENFTPKNVKLFLRQFSLITISLITVLVIVDLVSTMHSYPINILLEILSRCPRYLSHGPAAEM